DVVAVVAAVGGPGGGAEVGVVGRGSGRSVVVVPGRGPRAALRPPPRRRVALRELFRASGVVRIVPEGRDRSGQSVQERGGLLVAVGGARGDVAGGDQRRRLGRQGLRPGERDAVEVEAVVRPRLALVGVEV